MNFQEKMLETTADLRVRAAALAQAAFESARARAAGAAHRVESLRGSLAALKVAGLEFNKVARRHVSRLVKENSAIARDAGKDVGALARATFVQLTGRPSTHRKPRKPAAGTRGRSATKAG